MHSAYGVGDQGPAHDRIPSATVAFGHVSPRQKSPFPKYAPELKAKPRRTCWGAAWASIRDLPWFVFCLAIIVLACAVTWHRRFMKAADLTGRLLVLGKVTPDSLLQRLWDPHSALAAGTMGSTVVISLIVIGTAALQMAVKCRKGPRGAPSTAMSSIYLAVTALLSLLLWAVMLWIVALLAGSVVWLLSSVVVTTAAEDALRQATKATSGSSIDLQAPDIITKLQSRYSKTLRPLLTRDDQQLTDVFLNNTLVAIALSAGALGSSTCRSTCLDLTRFQASLGTTACICDTKTVKTIITIGSTMSKAITSSLLCLTLITVAASLLLVIMVARFMWAKHTMTFHSFLRRQESLPTHASDPKIEAFSIASDTEAGADRQKMVMWRAMNQAAPSPRRYTSDVGDVHHLEHSPGGRGSTVAFDEPEPEVLLDRSRRNHFNAAKPNNDRGFLVPPASAWRIVQ